MILVAAVAAGYAAALIQAKLNGRRLQPIELNYSWLVLLAVIPQILVFQIPVVGRMAPEAFIPYILVLSQALLVEFAVLNIRKPGVAVMGTGLLANFLVMLMNGGWMPIGPETVRRILPSLPADFSLVDRRLGLSKDWIMPTSAMRLPWLTDRFTLPDWVPYNAAFSLGDILISIGAFLLLWSLSNSKN